MIINVENLIVNYKIGEKQINILNISKWNIEKGSQIALYGPSGSGKSTLLNVIAGLLLPQEGSVKVIDKEINRLSEVERDHYRAIHIGYIFQNFNLFQGYTALENVLIGMTFSSQSSSKSKAKELLEAVGLSHRIKHYPKELSIGEQQRVAIARALAKCPEIILADEPTGSLDPINTKEVVRILKKISKDYHCTLIVVSHEKDVVSEFDKHFSFLEMNHAFAKQGDKQ